MNPQQDRPVSPARPHRRWIAWSVAGLLVLALAAHSAAWFYVTGQILDGIPVAVAQAAQDGWVIQAGTPTRAGWPGAAIVHVPNVSAKRAIGGTTVRAVLNHLDLGLFPSDMTHLRVSFGAPANVLLDTETLVDVAAQEAALLVPLSGSGPATLKVRSLVIGHGGVTIGRVDAQLEPNAVAGTAGPIMLDPPLTSPFDGGAQLALRLLVAPPLPRAATPAQSATLWQAAGGRVTMPEFSFDWGPLRAHGSLTGGLDPHLQPVGEARLEVTGALVVLEAASRAGLVPPGPASAARAVLTLLTLAAHGGPVVLPITLRDQTLTAAQFALLKLPILDWSP